MDVFTVDAVNDDDVAIEHLSVSFYMGFITFNVSFRDFYDRRVERTMWLHEHFANFIPFHFWRKVIDIDVNTAFLELMLPEDYVSLQTLTVKQVWTFLHNCIKWDIGRTDVVDRYFEGHKRLRFRRRKQP